MDANITNTTLPHTSTDETIKTRCCYTFHRYATLLKAKPLNDKLYTAIHMTAEETGLSAVYVSKILVEHGLKAAKEAFPLEFVYFIESKAGLDPWVAGAMTYAQNKLAKLWQTTMVTERYGSLSANHFFPVNTNPHYLQ